MRQANDLVEVARLGWTDAKSGRVWRPTGLPAVATEPIRILEGTTAREHADYLAAFRASIEKIAASPCEILLTPHPSSSNMRDRLAGKAPLFDPDGCKNFAAKAAMNLDEKVAKEATPK